MRRSAAPLAYLLAAAAIRAAAPDAIVAADGSGQHTSVQAAINAAPLRTGRNDPRWIRGQFTRSDNPTAPWLASAPRDAMNPSPQPLVPISVH